MENKDIIKAVLLKKYGNKKMNKWQYYKLQKKKKN